MVVYFNVIGWKRDQESGEANKLQRGLRISRICRKPTWCGDAPQSQSSLIGFSTRLKCTRVYLLGLIAIIRLVAPPSLRSASPRPATPRASPPRINSFVRLSISFLPFVYLPYVRIVEETYREESVCKHGLNRPRTGKRDFPNSVLTLTPFRLN